MRVLVADRLNEAALDEMRSMGVEVVYRPDVEAEDLAAALDSVNVLVVRGTEVRRAALEAGEALNLIIRAGAGVTSIDVRTASDRGVYVANCPGKNASAVAELTLTLVGCLDRRVPDAVQSLRAGHWEKEEFARARGLAGRTLGIVGVGHVGRAVTRLAAAYGMHVLGYSRTLTTSRAAEIGIEPARTLDDLARRSDVMTVHVELTERTRGLVSRRVLEQLPDEAIFVNTARSEVVDYDALMELIGRKRLRVGLDVFPNEPATRSGAFTHPIFRSGLVYATPHIGASTDEAQTAIAADVVRILRSFITKGEVPNVVNIAQNTFARYQLVVRHVDKVGSLANVLGVIKRHGINVQELDNTVFEGAKAACAKIRLDTRPSEACLQEIRAFDDEVLHVDLVTLPNLA
jgi:D-3-phosphoglycerate dehydrogenase